MMAKTFAGIHVPLVTPFLHGEIDWAALDRLLEGFATDPYVHGVVANGSTGECSALSSAEQEALISFVVSHVRGRKLVIAGTGTNNFEKTLHLTEHAARQGANAVLIVPPYYVRPNQEGIERYFAALASKINIDILLYNIPARTACNIEPETVVRLSERARFVGIKESSTDRQLASLCHRFLDSDFAVLSGDDAQFFHCLASRGDGAVLASAMLHPQGFRALYDAMLESRLDDAASWDRRLAPLVRALFAETNPIVVKHALALMHGFSSELRLPLIPPRSDTRRDVEALLESLKLWPGSAHARSAASPSLRSQ